MKKEIKFYWVIGGSIVLSVFILSSFSTLKSSVSYFFPNKDDISVTGSTRMDFTSNLIVWKGQFIKKDMNLKNAYSQIKKDKKAIQDFLLSKNVEESEIVFKSINIIKDYKNKSRYNNDGDKVDSEKTFNGYWLSQEVEITSKNVDLIENVANDITELIEQDVYITSSPPKYYYTNLGELKIEMIKNAAEDGLLRAQTSVKGGGGKLGELLETSIGVFQILGENSNDSFSWGGTLNTSHKKKTAYVNVKQRYEID